IRDGHVTGVQTCALPISDIAGGSHCMTPGYLENQLRQSLRNLNVDCVDVYYVHNPESQLSAVPANEFWRRLRAAFEFLEQAVTRSEERRVGEVGGVGVVV